MPLSMPPVAIGNNLPLQETTVGDVGAAAAAADSMHVHPSISWRGNVTLDAAGLSTVMFGRTFAAEPPVFLTAINPSGRPVTLEIVSYVQSGGLWTGVNIKGYRTQILPTLSGIIIIGPLISALSNFDVFGGSAASVRACVIALVPS